MLHGAASRDNHGRPTTEAAMAPGVQIALSGTLTFGVPLLCAVHELIALRRRRDGGGDSPPRAPAPQPPRTEPDRPRLPDCLIPPFTHAPEREKVLELA
jgi:hypothetical protein